MMKIVAALFLIIASVIAFQAPGTARPASSRMTMMFNFGKKSTSGSYEVGKGTAVRFLTICTNLFYSFNLI